MKEGEQRNGIHSEGVPRPRPELHLSADDWDLIRESVDECLRSYTEADSTWWEEDDDRPGRLKELLDKLTGSGEGEEDGNASNQP